MYTLLLFILIGVILLLRGNSIPTDGSGRIVITDDNLSHILSNGLICRSEQSNIPNSGDWYLHTTQLTTDGSVRIEVTDPRGWHRRFGAITFYPSQKTHRQLTLRRDGSIASGGRALEGVFTCHIPGDINTPVSVGIYYPSELHVECHLLLQYILLLWFILLCTFVFSKINIT